MAFATYHGRVPELSVSLPDFGPDGGPVVLVAGFRSPSTSIECVALPPGVRRRVSVWAALWLAGARRRSGPWVTVRLEPGEWAMVRRRAPWLRRAEDALALLEPSILALFWSTEMKTYTAINAAGERKVSTWAERL